MTKKSEYRKLAERIFNNDIECPTIVYPIDYIEYEEFWLDTEESIDILHMPEKQVRNLRILALLFMGEIAKTEKP